MYAWIRGFTKINLKGRRFMMPEVSVSFVPLIVVLCFILLCVTFMKTDVFL